MAREAPSISVVIPCYNAARFIEETLESALNQTYAPREIVLVDDGSKDDSAAIAESFGGLVRVMRQENQGESVARNRAMELATGDWIALLDADDRWEPTKLERQVAALQAAPAEVVCVYCDFYTFRDGERLEVVRRPEMHAEPGYRAQMLCNSDACVAPTCAIFRADLGREIRFPEETRYAEDMIFFAQLRDRGTFLRVPEPLAGYRVSGVNQSTAPGFGLRSVRSRYHWMTRNRSRYSPAEQEQIVALLGDRLVVAHDIAFWQRDNEVAGQCRALYQEMRPAVDQLPPSLRWPLRPRLLMQWKDRIDRWLGRGNAT